MRLPDGVDQRAVMQAMLDAGIATRRGVMCTHREPAYAAEPWVMGPGGLAEGERAQDGAIILPLHHELTEAEQDYVVATLAQALRVPAVAGDGRARRWPAVETAPLGPAGHETRLRGLAFIQTDPLNCNQILAPPLTHEGGFRGA